MYSTCAGELLTIFFFFGSLLVFTHFCFLVLNFMFLNVGVMLPFNENCNCGASFMFFPLSSGLLRWNSYQGTRMFHPFPATRRWVTFFQNILFCPLIELHGTSWQWGLEDSLVSHILYPTFLNEGGEGVNFPPTAAPPLKLQILKNHILSRYSLISQQHTVQSFRPTLLPVSSISGIMNTSWHFHSCFECTFKAIEIGKTTSWVAASSSLSNIQSSAADLHYYPMPPYRPLWNVPPFYFIWEVMNSD